MKKGFLSLLLTLSVSCFSQQICNLAPSGSGGSVTRQCSFQGLTSEQCITYKFFWQLPQGGSGNFNASVLLNSSPIELAPYTGDTLTHAFYSSGSICLNGSQQAQWSATAPVTEDESIIDGPQFAAAGEDLSQPFTLTFTVHGQRGFGVTFEGGEAEAK